MADFYVKSQIYTGKAGLYDILEGVSRVLIVTDRYMHESGKVSYLTEPLTKSNITYEIFSGVTPDPDISVISEGISIMLALKPQVLLALGGGSAIDAAKAMNFLAMKQEVLEKCKLVAIPTTSGTGSEVSKFAVVSDQTKAAKYPLVSDEMMPEAAILDAELVMSVPPAITADTGIDVLTHAIEAFVSLKANDFTDAAAEKAIKLVRSHLLKVFKEPDNKSAREGMHHASCLAGMAFSNAGLGLNHAMAHTLGAHFHIPHGRANGILLPYVMGFNAGCHDHLTAAAKRYARIARIIRIDGSSARQSAFNVVRTVKQYINKLDMPNTIAGANITRASFDEVLDDMVESALKDSCLTTNPRECTKEDIRNVFLRAYTGRLQ